MKRHLLLFAWLCLSAFGPAAAEDAGLAPGMVNPGYHDKPAWFKNSFLDLREDVAEATAAGKRVLLYFYQDGCPYCKKLLETNFALRDIEAKTRDNFDVIAINIWGDREVTDMQGASVSEKQFAAQRKVMFTPTLIFLDERGADALRVNGYYPPHRFLAALEYAATHQEGKQSFRDYLQDRSPAAAQGQLHSLPGQLPEPYRLDRRSGNKPLAVFFEQRECPPCDELHRDVLTREASRAQLGRFDAVVLDMWSKTPLTAPDGRTMTAAEWARELDVQYAPTLVMFDAAGREAFRTEAYLRAFHVQSALDYVASGAYREQPSFQRYIQARADALEAKGVHVDIME